MNKSVSLSLKSLFFLIVSIVILVVIILQLPTLLSYLKSDNDRINAILGIVGNIIGGIIGGIVAYYVAAYQIKKGNDQNNNTNLKQAHINLRLLLDEIDFNLQVFQIIEANSEDFQLEGKVSYLNKQLVNDQWNKILPSFADYISTEDFKDICELYRKIHFFKINSTTVNAQFITVTTTLIKKVNTHTINNIDRISAQIKE